MICDFHMLVGFFCIHIPWNCRKAPLTWIDYNNSSHTFLAVLFYIPFLPWDCCSTHAVCLMNKKKFPHFFDWSNHCVPRVMPPLARTGRFGVHSVNTYLASWRICAMQWKFEQHRYTQFSTGIKTTGLSKASSCCDLQQPSSSKHNDFFSVGERLKIVYKAHVLFQVLIFILDKQPRTGCFCSKMMITKITVVKLYNELSWTMSYNVFYWC